MELFQNLLLVCLVAAVFGLYVRMKKLEEQASKAVESTGSAAIPPHEAKEITRSAASGR
jgi:hypothetical protein